MLVVEGDDSLRQLFATLLRHLDVVPVSADDAETAVAALRQEAPPDVVLLDTRLPATDRAAVLSAIRSDPELEHVPIVTMGTGTNAPPAVVAHLVMPFRLAEFTTILLALLYPESAGA
ncbi:hypothetical protein AMOR_31030 [Anaeromyxobacter oryzae]|uniref:Response regulatory domain-containing protein n=1 Tax=Anaeromyxobacter oryzae TaxID=2918170 RepID=A0ABN6MT21_9BACT|nr:hypothetical protein AMOR_31030 [Anaeromyxobacter oryzae]